jgi:hypothetical protein
LSTVSIARFLVGDQALELSSSYDVVDHLSEMPQSRQGESRDAGNVPAKGGRVAIRRIVCKV